MANFPTIPMYWDFSKSTVIHYGNTKLAIYTDGAMALEGSPAEAALALVKHLIDKEYNEGLIEICINHTLTIKCENGFSLHYEGETKPLFWDELCTEFDRIISMKVFW